MPLSVRCPFCSAAMTAEAGQSVTCTACGATFVAQSSAASPPPPPPAPGIPMAPGPQAAGPGDMPCPMCGETIKQGARVCRFCKAQLGPIPGAPGMAPPPPVYGYAPPAPPPKKSSCLIWVILGGILLCCGGGVVTFFLGREPGAKQACGEQVAKLAVKVKDLAKDDAELEKLDSKEGTDFWRYVGSKMGTDQEQTAVCPGSLMNKFEPKVYRGPKKANPYSKLSDSDPIGCCPADAHKDGVWVIYKDGRTSFAARDSAEFKKAFEILTD